MPFKARASEAVSLFCRLNINTKRNLPVRAGEMGLLIYIVKTPEPVTSIMAADFFCVSRPMVSNMVKVLERSGFIARTPSPHDGRCFILTPSRKAIDLVEGMYSEYFRMMELLENRMGSDEFRQFIMLMEHANDIMKGERTDE